MCIFVAAAGLSAAAVAADVSIVATLASLGTQIAGAEAQAQAAQNQADYDAQIAQYEAALEQQRGNVEQVRYGIDAQREHAKMIAQRGSFSADLSFGNLPERASEMRAFQAFDSDIIARTTQSRILGLQLGAEASRTAAQNIRSAMTFSEIGAGFGALASLSSTATGMYDRGFLGGNGVNSKAVKYSDTPGLGSKLSVKSVADSWGLGTVFGG